MSFSSNYLALREKRKKKEEKNTQSNNTIKSTKQKSDIVKKMEANPRFEAWLTDEDSFAPVRVVTKGEQKPKTEKEKERTWFQKSKYFADGSWDKGDVTKTILGSATDLGENISSGIIGMGEKIVDAATSLATVYSAEQYRQAGLNLEIANAMQDKQTDGIRESFEKDAQDVTKKGADFVKKDLYDEEKVAKKIISAPVKALVGIDAETDSVFGEKSDALAQSGGQLLGQVGLHMVGVPWFVTAGATSFGSQAETALNEGAELDEAVVSGAISAGAEILTEKLSGGIKFGGKTLDDVLLQPLVNKISNKAVKLLVKGGLDAAGEGFEEVVSGFVSNLGTKLYKEEDLSEILFSEEALDEYLESFIGGAVLGGGSSAVTQFANRNAIELSENEQKVFDKEVENRIAEEEKDGKKVTKKEESAIRKAVLNDMLKGYISIDTIESTLGGETYNNYKKNTEQEKSLQDEFDTLNKMKRGDMTGEQIDRRSELKQQLEEIKNNSKTTQIKEQLSNEVFELAKDSRLAESYNEKARRNQSFEADLSKYDAKQQEIVKKAIESGTLNNTNRAHEFVDMVAKISADKGVLFDFTNNEKIKNSSFAVEGKIVNGYVDNGTITLNTQSPKYLNTVVGHEITHVLEGTELYNALQESVIEFAKSKGEYQSRYDALVELYKDVEGANIDNELTADLVGEYLFTDTDFINNLSTKSPNVFKRIYNEIKYLCKIATAGSKEARELERVKRAFDKAYKDSGKAKGDTKYSFVGVKSKSHSFSSFEQAVRLEDVGKSSSEEIRQQTGWFRGYDGQWRYEISDRDMEIDTRGKFSSNPDVRRYTELVDKVYFDMTATETETQELKALEKSLEGVSVEPKTLSELIKHDKLFAAYPQLKDMPVYFDDIDSRGAYNPVFKEIVLQKSLKLDKNKLSQTLIHEIQHAIQDIEGFASGSNTEYWRDVGIPESKLREYYEKTAGEIEARDSAQRSWRTDEARKEKRPDIDRTDVVFADDSIVGNSIVEPFTDKNGNRYDNAVLLDTSEFDNVAPRNWWSVLKKHIENRVDKSTFIMPVIDENGHSQMLEFAKAKERVSKNGKNPHSVLGDLYRTKDNISKLSAIHIDEIVEVSEESNPYYSLPSNHGWLDANGWLHRTANVVNVKNGNVYQITMDIAKAKDGRFILYALNGKTKKVGNADVNSLVVKATSGSEQNSNFEDILPQNPKKSSENTNYSLSDSEGNKLTEKQSEYFRNSKVRDADGNLLKVYHGTEAEFTVFDKTKGRSTMDIQGSFFSPWELDAKGYGQNVKAYYLNITNPASEGIAYKALNKFKGQNEAGIKAREYLESLGYDGVNNGNEEYIAFNSNQIKAADNLKPTDNEDVRYSLAEQSDIAPIKNSLSVEESVPYAPTFYSQMGKVVDAVKQEKLGASSVIPMLKGKGVKNEEIKWSGIEEFLDGKKSVTKQELQEFIAGSMLQIEERELSGGATKWNQDYIVLPDGENYRELIFKMPDSSYTNYAMRGHWGNVEGILAHARIQDFIDSEGKKVLFVEEIQSDWHNEGNKQGYSIKLAPSENKKVVELLKAQETLVEQMREKYQNGDIDGAMFLAEQEQQLYLERQKIEGNKGGVPDAPFHNNYHEYVLKRLLRMAAEEGYDSIGWTTADIQSERWSNEYAEGYRIEYDQDIPKFLNKYGKKWGAKVSTAYLPTVTEQRQDETDVTEVWSMDITDSMKESVLYEGQPLYSFSEEGEQSTKHGNLHIKSEDVAYQPAEDIAPTVSKMEKVAPVDVAEETATIDDEADIEWEEYPITEVKTNRGVIPIREYRDIMAMQYGYDDYADMRKHGVRFGDQYDDDYVPLAPTRKKASEQDWQEYHEMFNVTETAPTNVAQNDVAPLTDADIPPEIEVSMYDTEEYVPKSPLKDRDINEVGDRKIKSYQYENPEVKPFFQDAAWAMLGDLRNSTKGERTYNAQLHYDSGGEFGWMGTTRHTSPEIANLLDDWHYTYDQIEKGLMAIIEDNGKENNAVSKRIEFALDEMLREGYTDFYYEEEIPPNQEYINLLRDKEITEYNDEAFNYWASNLAEEEYKPTETKQDNIAPVREDIAPIKEVKKSKTPDTAQPTAKILMEEPKTDKEKSQLWSKFKMNFIDKASPFETLALKTGNREVDAKFNSIRYSDSKAQMLIGEGAEGVKSLKDIKEDVEAEGLTESLYEYIYHKHNVDRMSLESEEGPNLERLSEELRKLELDNLEAKQLFAISKEPITEKTNPKRAELIETVRKYLESKGVKNKPVFGSSVTAEMSQQIVDKYESENPKLIEYANEIYNYNNHLRDLLVEGGVISQETADLWQKMYPHYVPVRRLGDEGLNVNVPLDSGRTGVNAPIKKATGGNRDILPLFDTMAQRTLQTYKAIAKNRFGIELKNTLGTTVESSNSNLDEVIDSIDTQEELLQKGKGGRNPTFTVFENGKRVTFEITDEMYDAMKPTSEGFAKTIKPLNKASNYMRGVLTEYNPTFMLTNAIKDAQDVLMNSQHAAKTYANFPKAVKELASKGKWFTEYMQNGGGDNTYFDKQTNAFDEEESGVLSKIIGMPLGKISEANNFIERIPRLAEYIASRESGRSIDVSMLDAARVTTNFAAGGDVTKFLNRNGATFLNASVQGAAQQVRNIREAKANGLKGWVQLATKVAIAGLPGMLLNGLLWDDDEEYEELSDYVKENYYIVAKTEEGKFVRIPKGRALAVIQEAFTQVQNALTGDDEVDLQSFLDLAVSNLAPNNPIDNNIIAPIAQVIENKTWYGEDLVPTRLQDLPDAEQYDESTDALSKWLGETLNVSPYKINYLLNQYSGGVGDVLLPMLTPEAESGEGSFLLAPLKDKFTTDSVLNNQNSTDFYNMSDELTKNANSKNATDEDILKSKYFSSVSADIGDLYTEKRKMQNSDLSDKEKYKQAREIQKQINKIAEEALRNVSETEDAIAPFYGNTGDGLKMSDGYATIGGLHFRINDDGEWQKITDKQLEKQNEAINTQGITPSEYWDNKRYESAYEKFGKNALSKAITGDIEEYTEITSALNAIEADRKSNGDAISGSAKRKKAEYINSLDIDYGAKLILFKKAFTSDNRYNYEIIDYLSNRNDISYEEKVVILKELGFDVDSAGNVSWG